MIRPRRGQTFYLGVVVDVTAQQGFERELGELVDRYRLLTEVSPDVVLRAPERASASTATGPSAD